MVPELILAALLIAWACGGNPARLADAPIKHAWLIGIPVLIYAASWGIRCGTSLPSASWAFGALHLTSIASLIVLCTLNRRLPGVPFIAIGLLMNAIAIACNDGFMPASKDALVQVFGQGFVDSALVSEHVRSSIMHSGTRLWWLCDIIPKSIGPAIWRGVYSIGDMVMTAGISAAIIMLSRVPRTTERSAQV